MIKTFCHRYLVVLLCSVLLFLNCGSAKKDTVLKENEAYAIYKPTQRKKKTLYVGVGNPFIIHPKKNKRFVEVSIVNGKLIHGRMGATNYDIITNNFDPTYVLIHYKAQIDTIRFEKRAIPALKLYRPGLTKEGTIPLASLRSFKGFYAFLSDVDYDIDHICSFKVRTMDVIKIHTNQTTEQHKNVANKGPLLKSLFQTAVPGDVFVLSNIKLESTVCQMPDGTIKAESEVLTITD